MSGTLGASHLIDLMSDRLCTEIADLAGSPSPVASPAGATLGGLPPGKAPSPAATLALRQAAWRPLAEQAVSLPRLCSLAAGLPDRIALDVSGLDPDTDFPAPAGRIVLNLILLAADSLPDGGTVRLAGTATDVFVQIAGATAAWPRGMAACLTDEAAARSALTGEGSLQLALTALLARAAGLRLSLVLGPARHGAPAVLRLGG
jgi:histidine phosphotransferase ChpT